MPDVKLRVRETGGRDGYSPIVDLIRVAGGVRINIQDARGIHTAMIYDGGSGYDITVEDSGLIFTRNEPPAPVIPDDIEMTIDSNGHLIYSNPDEADIDFQLVNGHLLYSNEDNSDIDFRLVDGHLIMEVV